MKISHTPIVDAIILTPDVHEDERGYFMQSFNEEIISSLLPCDVRFMQDNEAYSTRGVVRGLHFQTPPYAQAKLIRVLVGEIVDVAVDIRRQSPTFGQHVAVHLSADNKKQFFIPEGFAHGYSVLSDISLVLYKVNKKYNPASEGSIYPLDECLKIDWGLKKEEMIISKRDQLSKIWKDISSPF